MPNRILKEGICASEDIHALSWEEEVLFYRILVNCDDYGCMDARPKIIRARCFPLFGDSLPFELIVSWLRSLAKEGLVFIYLSESQPFLKVSAWEKHQQIRAKRPKCPLPTNGCKTLKPEDITCQQLLSDSNRNPMISDDSMRKQTQTDSNRNPMISDDSNSYRNPIQSNPNPIRIQAADTPTPQYGSREEQEMWRQQWEPLFLEVLAAHIKKDGAFRDAAPMFYWMMGTGQITEAQVKCQLLPVLKTKNADQRWLENNGQYAPRLDKYLDPEHCTWKTESFDPKYLPPKERKAYRMRPRGSIAHA